MVGTAGREIPECVGPRSAVEAKKEAWLCCHFSGTHWADVVAFCHLVFFVSACFSLSLLNSLSQTINFHFHPTNSCSQLTGEELTECVGFRCFLG